MAKIAIIYYSSMGHAYQVAQAIEEGAREAGAEVRLRKVRELAPEEAIATNEGWKQHLQQTAHVPEATLDDLDWADGYFFGTPTRYGGVTAQLKQFFDTSGPLWAEGKLANKPVGLFTGAMNAHGGQESTLLTMFNIMAHWGAVIVPTGYTDPVIYGAGGNPYGISYTAPYGEDQVPQEVLAAARYHGGRVARFADVLAHHRNDLVPTQQEASAGAVAAGGEA